MEKIRILIADDHPLFRDGLRALLNSVADTEVVGEATSGAEAISIAATLQPDIILMDINMPGVNGIEATRSILQTSPHIGVLSKIRCIAPPQMSALRCRANARSWR